jgi:KDO2-lipid IV(A) lauroyltransferase
MLSSVLERCLQAASAGVASIPARHRYRVADAVTALVPLLAPRLYRRTSDNFARALRIPHGERLARASIRNFGRMAVDFLWVRTLDDADVLAATRLGHEQHVWAALAAGRGVVLVLPHLGCWDVAAARASASGVPVSIVTESGWQAHLAAASRVRPGVKLVPRDRSLRALLEALRRNEGVVLLSDLARPGLQTIEVPFLGGTAPLPSGPARLALKTGAPLVALACVRTSPFNYSLEFRPPIWPPRVPANRAETVETLTAQIAREFEALVRACPEQWYPFGEVWSNVTLASVSADTNDLDNGGER